MEAIDLVRSLRSVRDFEPKEIPQEVLENMFEAVRHTPSASNVQPWHFVVVSDAGIKKELSAGYANFIHDAAIAVVGCGDPALSREWYKVEVAIGMQHLVLAAWAQGVGSCWVDFSGREEKIRNLLNIPDSLDPVAMAAFGYPASIPEKGAWKKPTEQIVHYNSF
jgi:nitroreductase